MSTEIEYREFLNSRSGTAAVLVRGTPLFVYNPRVTGEDVGGRADADLVITGCEGSGVSLDFEVYGSTEADFRQRLEERRYKLRHLQNALNEVRRYLDEVEEDFNQACSKQEGK